MDDDELEYWVKMVEEFEKQNDDNSSNNDGEDGDDYHQDLLNRIMIDYSEDREILTVVEGMTNYYIKYLHKQPSRNSSTTGQDWVNEKLGGSARVCQENLRMLPHVFENLCNTLKTTYGLKPTSYSTTEERVAIFLYIVGQGATNRQAQDIFQRSGWTIGKHFYDVLNAVIRMSVDYIKPNEELGAQVHPHIRRNFKYHIFENCIGAIDGTHVRAVPPKENTTAYIGRKGYATQNILAVCDFDMCFTYVWAGWEGIAHDSRIFELARARKELKFPNPPDGKYYLVDSGYPNTKGFLAPYKNVRYHLPDFRRGSRASQHPRNRKERFNKAHSSLRSVIERSFGVWKARFKILKVMPAFPFKTQVLIVVATMTIHNFIRRETRLDDEMFRRYEKDCPCDDNDDSDDEQDVNHNSEGEPEVPESCNRREENHMMDDFRQSLLELICNSPYWT